MFGNGFINPYMYQPYYQAAGMARNLGGLSGLASAGAGTGASSAAASAGSAASGLGRGLFGRGLLSKFSFSGFLNGASKTLNVVNQAIPIFYQVKPMFHNAKTMFRIMGAVKDDKPTTKNVASSASDISSNTARNTTSPIQKETDVSYSRNISEGNELPTENPVFFI